VVFINLFLEWSSLGQLKHPSYLFLFWILLYTLVIFQLRNRKGPWWHCCCGFCCWNFLKAPEQSETEPKLVAFISHNKQTGSLLTSERIL